MVACSRYFDHFRADGLIIHDRGYRDPARQPKFASPRLLERSRRGVSHVTAAGGCYLKGSRCRRGSKSQKRAELEEFSDRSLV